MVSLYGLEGFLRTEKKEDWRVGAASNLAGNVEEYLLM